MKQLYIRGRHYLDFDSWREVPGFKDSQDRLALLASAASNFKKKPVLTDHSENLVLLRIMVNLLCLSSVGGTTKPG